MAIKEQFDILRQGADVWNDWRKKISDPYFSPDLTNAFFSPHFTNLAGANLYKANLNGANLAKVDLTGAILVSASLGRADLQEAILTNARLTGSRLGRANLRGAKLDRAYFRRAFLTDAMLAETDLTNADLSEANLLGAILIDVILDNTNFDHANFGYTVLANIDLASANGLEGARHHFLSVLNSPTMQLSKGKIPTQFLRGCGLRDWEIESVKLYNPALGNDEINTILYEMYNLRAQQALQVSPVFISYSHDDSAFVDKLSEHFNKNGIRFWVDFHHATAGRLEKQVDRAMRLNPTVLVILSEHSLKSDWVEHEVRSARSLEKELGHDILCPIALDGEWKASRWSKRLMEQIMEYNILDFSGWKIEHKFIETFDKLLRGLDLFYK